MLPGQQAGFIENRRVIAEGEDIVQAEFLKEKINELKSLEKIDANLDFIPYQGRLVVRYINTDELKDCFIEQKSGLLIHAKEKQINSKMNVGKILKAGSVFNFYNNNETVFFKEGDLVFFDAVKFTILVKDEYALVPAESVYGTTKSYELAAKIMSNIIQLN